MRGRLAAAACALLAGGAPAAARAGTPAPPADAATTTFDGSLLLYGEQSRARVVEPTVRFTRLYPNGQSLSLQLGVDVITGATPTGAQPTGKSTSTVQTSTTPSGRTTTSGDFTAPDAIPLSSFSDRRFALDADWSRPFGLLTPALSGHFSRERDYQSVGATARFSLDMMGKLATLTFGGGYNHDSVFPTGGTRAALDTGTVILTNDSQPKESRSLQVGLSRILTRRLMVGANYGLTFEQGYLTEPYKVVSLLGSDGLPAGQLTERRPDRRYRRDALVSGVYHFDEDILYLSYRRYWDDWGVKSNTFDLKYRSQFDRNYYFEPHLRYYTQSAADFFYFGLPSTAAVPPYATSDYRLGALRSLTLGGTLGFRLDGYPGEFYVRAEYIRQYGNGYPSSAVGQQQNFNLFPDVNIGSLVVGYTVDL